MSGIEIDSEAIRQLARLLDETGLTEIELGRGDQRLRVARGAVAVATALPPPSHGGQATAAADDSEDPGAVRSPMVGTVYLAPQPGSPPFAKPGDTITEGQTLLIVEAMKTMNPIRSPRSGILRRVLVADATPVEYGQALMILE